MILFRPVDFTSCIQQMAFLLMIYLQMINLISVCQESTYL